MFKVDYPSYSRWQKNSHKRQQKDVWSDYTLCASQVPEWLRADTEWLGRFVQLSDLHEIVSRLNDLFADADQSSIEVRSANLLALQSTNVPM